MIRQRGLEGAGIFLLAAGVAAADPSFAIVPSPAHVAEAFSVSGDGAVAVGGFGNGQSFVWTRDNGIVELPRPSELWAWQARAVSDDGSVVIGNGFLSNGVTGWRWTANQGVVMLPDLTGLTTFGHAEGISGNGSVPVGSGTNASGQVAVRWTAVPHVVSLGDLPGGAFPEARATDASYDGSVIVGYGTTDVGQEAFRWTAATGPAGIGDLDGGIFASEALAITGDATAIVGWGTSGAGREAFRWTAAGGMVGLGDLPGGMFSSEARGISADGSIVVGIGQDESGLLDRAFIWTEQTGMVLLDSYLTDHLGLDLGGWTTRHANAISADGTTIVGYASHETLTATMFVVVIPAPGAVGLGGIGALLLVGRRR